MAEQSIPGTRPGTERTPSKQYSISYLQEKPVAAQARRDLYQAVWRAEDLFKAGEGKAVPCVGNEEKWSSDVLPSDRDAQLMCATCPRKVYEACDIYRQVAHPAWGVFAGHVQGRALEQAMKEDDEDAR